MYRGGLTRCDDALVRTNEVSPWLSGFDFEGERMVRGVGVSEGHGALCVAFSGESVRSGSSSTRTREGEFEKIVWCDLEYGMILI